MSNVMVKEYYGTSTPEDMDIDEGVQELAAAVLRAAFKDRNGGPYKFLFTEWMNPKSGTKEWRALGDKDDEWFRDYQVSRAEVDGFVNGPEFDFWVRLMGGTPERWHRIFKGDFTQRGGSDGLVADG